MISAWKEASPATAAGTSRYAFYGLRVAAGGDVLKVGVFEVGGVFEAVAEEAVEGDVGCPDEG